MKKYIKYSKWPKTDFKSVIKIINAYLNAYWSWHGKYEQMFIKDFCNFTNSKYGIMTTSGTAAIEAALVAIGAGSIDNNKEFEIIIPAITWITTATIGIPLGCIPVIVDVNPDTMCISPDEIEKAITPKTKAIIMVHIYSAICDIDRILEIAKKHNLYVIEDCAQAHGAMYKNKHVGTFGDIGIFSFQQSKLLTAGEGGICITNNKQLAKKIEKYVHVGDYFEQDNEKLKENFVCRKYIISEFQTAILTEQLNNLPTQIKKRIKNAKIIQDILSSVPSISFQDKGGINTTTQTFYIMPIILNFKYLKAGTTRLDIINSLKDKGINLGTAIGSTIYQHKYWNIPTHKYIKKEIIYAEELANKKIISIFHPLLLMNKKDTIEFANIIKNTILQYTIDYK